MKVNLTEKSGIRNKGVCRFNQTVGEEAPEDIAGEIKKKGGDSIRRKSGDFPENEGKGQGREEWLEEMPSGTENRLFINGDKITPDEERDEIAAAPEF